MRNEDVITDDELKDMTDDELDAFIDECEEFYDTGDDVYNELTGIYPNDYFENIKEDE